MTPKFLRCIDFTLGHEGGYVNDPRDPGGETKYGISKRSYPHVDIKSLTLDQAKKIYYEDWWVKYNYEQIKHESIAKKLLNIAVNTGQSPAVKILQRAINVFGANLDVDGKMGPKTLAAIAWISYDNVEILYRGMCHFQAVYYTSLNMPVFLRGWLLRAFS